MGTTTKVFLLVLASTCVGYAAQQQRVSDLRVLAAALINTSQKG